MKIFTSWSGDKSHRMALVLKDWLPTVIQECDLYVSSTDIDKGSRWSIDIAKQLSDSYYGIICVTKENIDEPWINFEAGALSKLHDISKVSPFLLDINRSDVKGPLQQFQSTIFEKDDVFKLVMSINKLCEKPIDEKRFNVTFDKWWVELDEKLSELKDATDKDEKPRKQSPQIKLLEELLEYARTNQQEIQSVKGQINNKLLESGNKVFDIKILQNVICEYNQLVRIYNELHSDQKNSGLAVEIFESLFKLHKSMNEIAPIASVRIGRLKVPEAMFDDE